MDEMIYAILALGVAAYLLFCNSDREKMFRAIEEQG